MVSYPLYGLSPSAVGTSCFFTTYDSGAPFMPQNVSRYSYMLSNVFNQSLECNFGVVTEPSVASSYISHLPASFLTPANVTFLKVTSLETLSWCLVKYTASIKLLSALAFTLKLGSGSPVSVIPPGRRRSLQIFLTDSSYRDLNSSIELIAWLSYTNFLRYL